MAKRKRKSTAGRGRQRRRSRAQDRMPAGLVTLFLGLILMALAFVPGSAVWKTLHDALFGVFGCGSFVVGAATMVAACYQNGVNAWLSGGALGAVLGGNLLLLCGRPAANLVMAALALCASLYIFDITPAEVWQWLCNVGGGVHEKGVAVYEQNAARRAERRAERLAAEAEEGSYEEEDPDELDEDFEDDEETGLKAPGWLSGVLSWGHKVTKELEGEAEPEPPQDPALPLTSTWARTIPR